MGKTIKVVHEKSMLDRLFDMAKDKGIEKGKEEKTITSKCPMNKKIEVIWHKDILENLICSFSGRENCKKCIKKGDYPKK